MIIQLAIEYLRSGPNPYWIERRASSIDCCTRQIAYYLAPYEYEKLNIGDFVLYYESMEDSEDFKAFKKLCPEISFLQNFSTIKYSRVTFCVDNHIFDNIVNHENLKIAFCSGTNLKFNGFYKQVDVHVRRPLHFDIQVDCEKLNIHADFDYSAEQRYQCGYKENYLYDRISKKVIRTPKKLKSLTTYDYLNVYLPNLESSWETKIILRCYEKLKEYCVDILNKSLYSIEIQNIDSGLLDKIPIHFNKFSHNGNYFSFEEIKKLLEDKKLTIKFETA